MVDQYLSKLKKKYNLGKKADLETILRDYEVNINEPNENGKYLLHLLITEEDLDGIRQVLSLNDQFKTKKADPNVIDPKLGWSPLVTAINQGPTGFQDAIFELLRSKADPNLEIQGLTPIQWAAKFNQIENIKVLQKYGGDINVQNDNGNCLHFACADENLETIEYLLQQGASLRVQNKNGDTPLHICAINGNFNALMTIIKFYVKDSPQQNDEVDESAKESESVKELKEIFNLQNSLGNTVLHESVHAERQTMTEKLRRLGYIDESIQNSNNQTARDIENSIKDEKFREGIEKQRLITEQRERKKLIQEERRQKLEQQVMEEEQIQKERKKRDKIESERDPEADAKTFKTFALLMFIALLVILYFLFDYMAKQGKKGVIYDF